LISILCLGVSQEGVRLSGACGDALYVRAICHVHSVAAVTVAAACNSDVLRASDLEMIKGLGIKGDDVLEVPIVSNQPTEPELVPDILRALKARH
jgi:ribulose-5-phosphate 4-epimerase/fuculose-1-phosphate aldolase